MVQSDLFGDQPLPVRKARSKQAPAKQPQHTWFFALRPSPEDAQRIHAIADDLLAAKGVTGKRIGPDRLHITLDLVGHDVSPEVVAIACRAADSIRFSPFETRFDSLMTFTAPSGPVVLLGTDGLKEVRELRTALASAMADCGFNPPRTYQPHMTLSYDPRHRLPQMPVDPIGFAAMEFALVKSHIGHSRHEVIRTWPCTVM
ncbi:MAG: 2'-5' RNA ligase family protein [Pseudohongiellaceae bacterium]